MCSKSFTTYKRKSTVARTVKFQIINNEGTIGHPPPVSLISRKTWIVSAAGNVLGVASVKATI